MALPLPTIPGQIECPACMAAPGEKCNVPTETGRRDVSWHHVSRESRAQEATEGYIFGDSGRRKPA